MGTLNVAFYQKFLAELIILAAIMFVEIYTSYTDIRNHRIPNKFTLGLLFFGLSGQFFFLYLGHTTFDQIILRFFVGFILAYFLFMSGLWAPGDAKLFWACAVALPPTTFSAATTAASVNFPVWALALNALLLTGLVVLVSLIFFPRQTIPSYNGMGPMRLLRRGLELVGTTGLTLGVAILAFTGQLNLIEIIVINLFLYRAIDHFVPRDLRALLVVPGIGVLAFLGGSLSAMGDYGLIWSITWFAESGYIFLRHKYASFFVEVYHIASLQEGLTPREFIYRVQAEKGGSIKYMRTGSLEKYGEALCEPGKPLSRPQAGLLRSLSKSGAFGDFNDEVVMAKDIPYAPFLLVATCVTVFSSGNIVVFVAQRWKPMFPVTAKVLDSLQPVVAKLLNPLI